MSIVDDIRSVSLTPLENVLIVEECVLQEDTSSEAIAGMAEAYVATRLAAMRWLQEEHSAESFEKLILNLIVRVKYQTVSGYRTTPVRFDNYSFAVQASLLPRAMEGYCATFVEQGFEDADEAYFYFEQIHPFVDGNGRVGWLLWLLYASMRTGVWPTTLPPTFEELQKRNYR